MVNVKLQKKIKNGRTTAKQRKIQKSGRNKFHKFQYYELQDLLPIHDSLCNELHIDTNLNLSVEGFAILDVVDLEQDDDQNIIQFYISLPLLNQGNATQEMQTRGGLQTYAYRYLLLQLWNFSDPDTIDSSRIGLNTSSDELIQEAVSSERIDTIARNIGNTIYKHGGDNRNKKELMSELNNQLKKKNITNDEYIEVKKMIEKVGT